MRAASDQFERDIEEWICAAWEAGARVLPALLDALPGVYPVQVNEALARLARAGRLPAVAPLRPGPVQTDRRSPHQRLAVLSTPGLVPHPLDADWRFDAPAIERLRAVCAAGVGRRGGAILLGVPSLADALATERWCTAVTLFDRNAHGAARVLRAENRHHVRCDLLRDPLARRRAGVVVLDPPWYPDEMYGFLWGAAGLVREGGRVLVCAPPIGTRPGIRDERVDLFARLHGLGLVVEGVEAGVLPYVTPPFEANALRAAGIQEPLVRWRRGDLLILRRVGPRTARRPAAPPVERWSEANIGGVRIRVRRQHRGEFRDPRLRRLVPGDVLSSVSRRDPRRAQADVWTSGNRVFACDGSGLFTVIAQALAANGSALAAAARYQGRRLSRSETLLVHAADEALQKIVSAERVEYLAQDRGEARVELAVAAGQ